jgi:hypothetical protein
MASRDDRSIGLSAYFRLSIADFRIANQPQAGIFYPWREQHFVVLRSQAPGLAKGARCLLPFISQHLAPKS